MKIFVFLILLFLFNPCLACIQNGVEIINVPVSYSALSYSLLLNARYNYYYDDYIYLISLNNSNVGLRLTNDSIAISLLIDSNLTTEDVDWSSLLYSEIYWLINNSVINLSSDNLNLIVNNACCHTYYLDNDIIEELFIDCVDQGFLIPIIDYSYSFISVLLSVLPSLLLAVYLINRKKEFFLAFLIGCFGWFIAFFLRQQLLSFIYGVLSFDLLLIVILSILAGVFEEVTRYLLLKNIEQARAHPLLFGIGWGFFEALLIFAFNISAYILLNQPVDFNVSLLGAFERNIAILIHVSLTFIIFKALKDVKYLYLGITLHFLFNFLGGILLISGFDYLFIELVLLFFTLITAYYVYSINKKFIKKLIKSSHSK